jgi:hypothetical protein
MSTVEIKKSQAASVAHGRGSDSYRTPARYDIIVDGAVVGKLGGAKQTYMSIADWSVVLVNADGSIGREIRSMLRTKKAAVAWITANVDKFRRPGVLAEGNGTQFWLIAEQVYRVTGSTVMDVDGLPMSRRWECSLDHWNKFRKIYDWVSDVK